MRAKRMTWFVSVLVGLFATSCGGGHPLLGTWRADIRSLAPTGTQATLVSSVLDIEFRADMTFTATTTNTLMASAGAYASCTDVVTTRGTQWNTLNTTSMGTVTFQGTPATTRTRTNCRDAMNNVVNMTSTPDFPVVGSPTYGITGSTLVLTFTNGRTETPVTFQRP